MRYSILSLLAVLTALPALAGPSPYDAIEKAYAPYMAPGDPLAFPMKVRAVSESSYTFWRGTKDLFYGWCKGECADWFADRDSFVCAHGDLHFGNIGTYAINPFGKLAFGLIDFDESSRLPFQVELLQGLITFQAAAEDAAVELTAARRVELAGAMFEAYREAIGTGRGATDALRNDSIVSQMLSAGGKPYARELGKYTDGDGKFRTAVLAHKKLKEILRPAPQLAGPVAEALARALSRSPSAKAVFVTADAGELRRRVKDVVQRTRLGSSGSQGLKKYLVLMDKPFRGVDNDVIVYLKQQIPAAPERCGAVPRAGRSPGQRCAEDMDALTTPHPLLNDWCELAGESYWLGFKEPWSNELGPENVSSYADLLHLARIWGAVAGAAHGGQGRTDALRARLTPALLDTLRERADQYVSLSRNEYASFKADPRTTRQVKSCEETIARLSAGE